MYDSMKNKILQIFSDATIGAESTPDIKVEPSITPEIIPQRISK